MSWDIVLFNSRQKIASVEEVEETQLEPTDFGAAFESHFTEIIKDDDHWKSKARTSQLTTSLTRIK